VNVVYCFLRGNEDVTCLVTAAAVNVHSLDVLVLVYPALENCARKQSTNFSCRVYHLLHEVSSFARKDKGVSRHSICLTLPAAAAAAAAAAEVTSAQFGTNEVEEEEE